MLINNQVGIKKIATTSRFITIVKKIGAKNKVYKILEWKNDVDKLYDL